MGRIADFKALVKSGKPLSGTFLKTPHHNMIEVMAQSGLDFVCLDAEHAPFDRAAIDACMAVSRALDYPVLVRVGDSSPREILWAWDCGAAGIVVTHVHSVERAEEIACKARFGKGGRGFAGTPRWGGFGTEKMADLLERSDQETVVFAQIEEDYAVPLSDQIAAIDGIDALFAGPSDLTVSMGHTAVTDDLIGDAMKTIGKATKAHGKGYASYIGTAEAAAAWHEKFGVHIFFVASEHNWMRSVANATAATISKL